LCLGNVFGRFRDFRKSLGKRNSLRNISTDREPVSYQKCSQVSSRHRVDDKKTKREACPVMHEVVGHDDRRFNDDEEKDAPEGLALGITPP
jgi:hypothetical protein